MGYRLGCVAGSKIYWIDDNIQCADLDGSNIRDIVTGVGVIDHLALDVAGGKIYWASAKWNSTKETFNPYKIQCADLDGSNVQDIVTGLDGVWGFALDVTGGKMYWTSAKWNSTNETWDSSKIQCANLDGSNVQDIGTGLNSPGDIALGYSGWQDILDSLGIKSSVRTWMAQMYKTSSPKYMFQSRSPWMQRVARSIGQT